MNKRQLSLDEHQAILYEILYAVDDFCKAHDIKYYLAHGSLLGAVRHHGIIPWDDDVDLWMKREDYEKFLFLTNKYIIPGFTVYSFNYTKNYYYPFIKVGKNKTLVIEPYSYVPSKGMGINIDIFPIDGCPSVDFLEAKIYAITTFNTIWSCLHTWTNLRWSSFRGWRQKLVYIKYLFPYMRRRIFTNLYNSVKKYSVNACTYFGNVVWNFRLGDCAYKKEWISETIYMPFGNRLLPVPKDFDAILKSQYGDYMTPPPLEKRKSTHEHGLGVYKIIE